jgi:hypothetical protein
MRATALNIVSFCVGAGVGSLAVWHIIKEPVPTLGVSESRTANVAALESPPFQPMAKEGSITQADPPEPPPSTSVIVASTDYPSKVPRESESPTKRDAARQVEKQYGAFLKKLEARGGNAGLFRSMLVERQMIVADVVAASRAQGIDVRNEVERKTVNELVRKSVSEYNQEIKAAVGDQVYQAWVESERMKGEFNLSQELARRLTQTAPLQEGQQGEFVRILFETKDASGWKHVSSVVDEDGSPMLMRQIPPEAIEKMRRVLEPEQMATFIYLFEEQKRDFAASRRVPPPR